jgi:RNA-binding protein Musashi
MAAVDPAPDNKLFVGGLPPAATDETLKEFASKWGNVTEIKIMVDKITRNSRGFGFITFETAAEVRCNT